MRAAIWFGLAFTLAAAIIVAGFWRSFFSDPSQNDAWLTIHGILATGWLVILVAQPWLMAGGHSQAHRIVGRISVPWVTLLVISMSIVNVRMLSAPIGEGNPLPARVAIGFVNTLGIPLFAVLYGLAIRCAIKGDIRHHMRLMAGAVAAVVPPGLARIFIPIMHGFGPVVLFIAFGVPVLCLLMLMAWDGIAAKRFYWGSLVAVVGLVGTVLLVPMSFQMTPYLAFIRSLGYPG